MRLGAVVVNGVDGLDGAAVPDPGDRRLAGRGAGPGGCSTEAASVPPRPPADAGRRDRSPRRRAGARAVAPAAAAGRRVGARRRRRRSSLRAMRSPGERPSATALAGADVVVCCGSGGVGKTTTAAVIGMEAARTGRRAVVVTIDPARRLADALGLPGGLAAEPAAGRRTTGPGELWAMMLDTATAFDALVRRTAADDEQAERILANPFYRNISGALSGTQEYMAAETLYQLHDDERFDVVVVDTPPSRNALDFLAGARRARPLPRPPAVPPADAAGAAAGCASSTRRRSRCCGRSARSSGPTCWPTPSPSSRPSPAWRAASATGPTS